MSDRDDFLAWFDTTWRDGDRALHDGDAGPRLQTWSNQAPVTLFGAWFTAEEPATVRALFHELAAAFSDTVSYEVDLIAADVSGDLAYTVHRERTSTSVRGEPRTYVLRVTQVYRHEKHGWKVVHHHGDEDPSSLSRESSA